MQEGVASMLALIAALATFIIGMVVWFAERTNYLRIVFLWLTIFVACWIVSNVMFAIGPVSQQYPIALISYSVAMLVAVQTLLFVIRLVGGKYTPITFTIVILGYIFAFLSGIPGLLASGVVDGAIVTDSLWITVYGFILTAYLVSACAVLMANLNHKNVTIKYQATIVLLGVVGASLIGISFNLILPIMGNYQFIQLGPSGATIFVLAIAYAIMRHGLFDLRAATRRTVAYSLTLTTLAVLYLVVAISISRVFLEDSAILQPTGVALALCLALIFQPIKKFFDRLTNRLFYKDSYDPEEFYVALSKVLTSTTDLRRLLKNTSGLIADTLKSDQVFFFVFREPKGFVTAGTDGHSRIPLSDAVVLRQYQQIITDRQPDLSDETRRMLKSHRLSLVMPLIGSDEVKGFLCLGEHKTSAYSNRDINVLKTISNELVIAIQNALSVQEVRELNASLEQRIDSATRELRLSNAQLQRLDEAKDEFISMASHQLRTPLTSIKGYISMMLEGDVGSVTPQQKHVLQEAFIGSERMVRLIGDFLNVSRLQTGKFIIEKRPTDIAKLIDDELESLEPNAKARGLKFKYSSPKKVPILNLDENKIQQVIMNFADNAIFYSEENSVIKVALKVSKDWIEYTVVDTGIGVPAEEQSGLFKKFFRATNARKQRPDGTGVGLFLAKKVIDAHDGEIIFESKEGKGSTFGFRLPIKKLLANDSDQLKDKPSDN